MKKKSNQFNITVARKGAIKGFSHEKLYQGLGLEYLYQWRWVRRLCLLYKKFSTGQPSYIYNLLSPMRTSDRPVNLFNTVSCRSEYFKKHFIPKVVNEWNNLDHGIHSSPLHNIFHNTLLKFIRPAQRKSFNITDSIGIKLFKRLRLGISHLHEHKSRHSFRETLNPLCPGSIEAETTTHYFLCWHFYNAIRATLIIDLNETDSSIPT